jgi:molybdopterin converting factor small subunit
VTGKQKAALLYREFGNYPFPCQYFFDRILSKTHWDHFRLRGETMPEITFNAFSFLQKKLKAKNIPFSNVSMTITEGTTARSLVQQVSLSEQDVEVVFINGKVNTLDTVLQDKDRVAFVPHGTPGPYRVLLGFKAKGNG